jgi:hypothetical protein
MQVCILTAVLGFRGSCLGAWAGQNVATAPVASERDLPLQFVALLPTEYQVNECTHSLLLLRVYISRGLYFNSDLAYAQPLPALQITTGRLDRVRFPLLYFLVHSSKLSFFPV